MTLAMAMADAQQPFGNTKAGGSLCGTARKSDLRRSSLGAMDDNIRECHASTEPGSQRLQDSLLRGEPTRQALDPIGPVTHFIQLFLNKAALDQGIAWVLNPVPHLVNVDQIDPVSDDVHIRCPSLSCRLRVAAPAKRI